VASPKFAFEHELWTVDEVAEHMRVSAMTVYRLIKAGDLPAIRVGRGYRIRTDDLGAYLNRGRFGTQWEASGA
jgi:excisionase family DNA binding protein